MKKFLISSMCIIMASPALAAFEVKCYNNKEFASLSEKEPVISLFNSRNGNQIKEIMVSLEGKAYMIEYQRSTNEDATKVAQYCVTGIMENVSLNDKAFELLNNLLEKTKGQKT